MSTMSISQSDRAAPARSRGLPLFWRIFTYLLLFVVVNLVANLARVGMDALGLSPLASRLAFTAVYIAGVLLLTYIYRRSVDRRSWSGIGLSPLSNRMPELAIGLGAGILIAAIVFGFEYGARWIQLGGSTGSTSAVVLLIDSLLLAAAFGMSEELCMRGYIFRNLGESRPIWQATLITGVVFGAFHLLSLGLGVRGLTFFIFAMALNVLLVLTRLMTGSLWMAIGLHTAFDWAAINIGLGSVVLADQHLLVVQRTLAVPAEDVLATIIVVLGIGVLVLWARRRGRTVDWNAVLTEESQASVPPAS